MASASNRFQPVSAVRTVSGDWHRASDRIAIGPVTRKTIYRPPQEPGFAAWCTVWREADGALKLCLTEAVGDLSRWPPSYNFNADGIRSYLVTLCSRDGGESWTDTGFRTPTDPGNTANSDHGFQHVVSLPDGRLLRSGVRFDPAVRCRTEHPVFDASRNEDATTFPFRYETADAARPYATFNASCDGGATWHEIYRSNDDQLLYFTGFHRLKSGLLVATGAFRSGGLPYGFQAVVIESDDDGKTWSEPRIFAENSSVIRGLCEESDFTELPDGRLLLINRVVGHDGNNVQMYLTRDASGCWTASSISSPEGFIRTGYPFMLRTSDGTIFHDKGTALLYSCDDGASWHELKLGCTYYGRLLEPAPGRLLSISQNNIGDSPFPWRYDAGIIQRSFHYRRTAVFEQTNPGNDDARAETGPEVHRDFHLYARIRAERRAGIAWGPDENDYYYAEFSLRPDGKKSGATAIFWRLGHCRNGQRSDLRCCYVDTTTNGEAEIQLDCKGTLFQAAIKPGEGDWSTGQSPATYLALEAPEAYRGKLYLYADGRAGFSDVRIAPEGGIAIRDHWANSAEPNSEIALDAGRVF